MTNWIEVTDLKKGKKLGLNFNNYDSLEPRGKHSVFKKAFFENMDVRIVIYEVKESYEEVKRKISMASNPETIAYTEPMNIKLSDKEAEKLVELYKKSAKKK